jgi:hypothetical protein
MYTYTYILYYIRIYIYTIHHSPSAFTNHFNQTLTMPGHAMAASQTRLHQAEAQAGTWPTAQRWEGTGVDRKKGNSLDNDG